MEIKHFLEFKVSKSSEFSEFQSFKVPKFQSFKVSKFQNSERSKLQSFQVSRFEIYNSKFSNGVRHATQHKNNNIISNSQISQHNISKHVSGFSGIVLSFLVSREIYNIGFGAQGHVRKCSNHGNEGFEVSHLTKSKSYKFKMEQTNTTELLSISFPDFYHNNGSTLAPPNKQHTKLVFQVFPDLR